MEVRMHPTPTSRIVSKVLPVIVLALAIAATPAFAQKKKPAPPDPKPLTITFDDAEGDTVTSDGLGVPAPYGADDGASINSAGGLALRLAGGARSLNFSFDWGDGDPDVPAACVLGAEMSASTVDLRFNVVDDRGYTVGVESMGVGTTIIGNGSPYGVAGIVNFVPEGAPASLLNVALRLGDSPDVSLSRVDATTWTLTSNASIVVQCTVALTKGRRAVYELGPANVRFGFEAVAPQ
jgi:hypothetical protein